MANILWFKEIRKKDIPDCGGKGASLGEMYNSGIPVPPGFVVTAGAYKLFLEVSLIADEIYFFLGNLNVEDNKELQAAAKKIQEIIIRAQMPKDIIEDIIESYESLNVDEDVF
ncbi:MAG: PEP/pyruvate-binding domain-containing protein, partial [Nanoarchaeota archaeon]|nr:PEP/pyruvate-binding domain-containing protein [Nanoarchaeota archaeon]